MTPYPTPSDAPDPIAQAAAEWAVRHDRALTAREQDDFSAWLASDPRHRAAWAEHRWGWDEFDRLAGLQTSVQAVPDPDLLAPPRPTRAERWLLPSLGLAAAILIAGVFLFQRPAQPAPTTPLTPAARPLALIEQQTMPDGSVIELNRGAVVTVHYAEHERRLRLERGEAHFKVAKDATRPFFVEAGGVTIRAVGTAFNVRLDPAAVEVLVTEGTVGVHSQPASADTDRPAAPALSVVAGERTVVSLAPAAPPAQVTAVPPAEIEARLAWQPRLLDFTDAPLAEIVAEFNRRNPVRIALDDASLRDFRLSATFRSDNVAGFVRLMESDFGMHADWQGEDRLVLSKRP